MSTAALGYGQFLRVALAHLGDLPKIEAAIQAAIAAPIVKPKWEATKVLGDAIEPLATDLVALQGADGTFSVMAAEDVKALEADPQFAAAAFDGHRLQNLFKLAGPILQNLPALIQLLGPLLGTAAK